MTALGQLPLTREGARTMANNHSTAFHCVYVRNVGNGGGVAGRDAEMGMLSTTIEATQAHHITGASPRAPKIPQQTARVLQCGLGSE